MLSSFGLVLALYFEFGTRQCYLNLFRLKRRPDALKVDSRGGALYQARLLVSRVPRELTDPLLWSISSIYSGVRCALCFIFIHLEKKNPAQVNTPRKSNEWCMKTWVILPTAGRLDQRWPSAGLQSIPRVLRISPTESLTGSINTHTNELSYTNDENAT